MKCPRRPLLAGVGLAVSASLSGCLDQRFGADESDGGFDSLLEYVPSSIGDAPVFSVADHDRLRAADDPTRAEPTWGASFEIDPESISKSAIAHPDAGENDAGSALVVLPGDVDVGVETEPREASTGTEYGYASADEDERTVPGDEVLARTGDVVLLADSTATIDAAVAAAEGEEGSLLEDEPGYLDALEAFESADRLAVFPPTDDWLDQPVDADEIRYTVHAVRVIDADALEVQFGYEFADASAVTDDTVAEIESAVADDGWAAEPSIDVDGTLVTVTTIHDLAAAREMADHESPGTLRVGEVDLEAEVIEIEVGRGDPTPVDELTFEVNDDPADPDVWADGATEIEAGDTILLETDVVEPNTSIRLRHEYASGASASGTSILTHFDFEFDYAFDVDDGDGDISVVYADDVPLDGDRLTLAVHDEDARPYPRGEPGEAPEPLLETEPWAGETLSRGDEATLADVEPGVRVVVGWDGSSTADAIAQYSVSPPGAVEFEYDYESSRLSTTLDPEEPQAADAYELRIDGEPARTQWRDETASLTEPATIATDDVAVGSEASVVWAETETSIGRTTATPSLELELDAEGSVTHVGGDSLPVSSLRAEAWFDDDREEFPLGDELDGTFEEGDAFPVGGDGIRHVQVSFEDDDGQSHPIAVTRRVD